MQNFLIYPNRRFVVWTKYIDTFLTCSSAKYGIFNTLCKNFSFIKQTNRLCFPLTQKTDLQRCRNLNKLELRYLGDVFRKRYFFPYQCTARNFSTNSTNHDQNNDGSDKKSRHEQRPNEILLMFGKMCAIVTLIMTAYFIFFLSTYNMALDRASWNDFINEILLKGEVEEIRIHPNGLDVIVKVGAMMKDKKLGRAIYVTDIPDLKDIEEKIREIEKHVGIAMEDGVPIRYVDMTKLINALYFISSLGLFILLFKFFPTPLFKGKFNVFGDLKRAKYTLIHPVSGRGVRFKDVAGLQEAKMEVMEFVDYLKNPEKYKKLGAKVPKGALLLGPPGCGKTLLAKAVATESNVPFLSMNGSEFIEIIGGIGAARVRSLFEEAKTRAPSIVYIDEIDAIGKKRSVSYVQASNSESERTLNQLLVEMDGMTSAEDIIVLASTNRPDVLDNALLRPGRFDRHILIDFPTLEERVEIFEYHLKSLCLEGSPLQFAKYLAHLTPGFTGAEIANVCNEAALHAASEKKTKVNKDDLMYAVDKVLGGTVKKSSTLSPAEKKVIVYHEAGHAIAAWLLEHVNPLIKVTVVPRTKKLLGFSQYFDTDLKLQSSEHLFGRMCVLLGGRVAENIMFNRISTRAQSDLKKVTEIAYYKVQQYGMSPSVGLISFHKDQTSTKTKKPYSKKLASVMDAEVRRIITEAYKRTDTLLQSNKDKLVLVAEALLKKETLTYKDIESLIGPPPFGKKSVTDLHEVNAELE